MDTSQLSQWQTLNLAAQAEIFLSWFNMLVRDANLRPSNHSGPFPPPHWFLVTRDDPDKPDVWGSDLLTAEALHTVLFGRDRDLSFALAFPSNRTVIDVRVEPVQENHLLVRLRLVEPQLQTYFDDLIARIEQVWPEAAARGEQQVKTRRGPRGYPREERRKLLREYLAVQDDVSQDQFCDEHQPLSASTLRRWLREYEAGAKWTIDLGELSAN